MALSERTRPYETLIRHKEDGTIGAHHVQITEILRDKVIISATIGEALPLTHYIRIVRAIMLKGASIEDLRYDAVALFVLMLIAMTIAVLRFRRTLD